MKPHFLIRLDIEKAIFSNSDVINLDNCQGIGKLSNLEELIFEISERIPNLKKISIGNSNLTQAPSFYLNFNHLEELLLQDNNLESLFNIAPKKLPKLKYLCLQNNNFKKIPDRLERLPENCIVNLKGNPLSLEGLLTISTSSKIMYCLDDDYKTALDPMKVSTKERDIARSIVNAYPTTSIEAYKTLFPLIKAELNLSNTQ